MNNFMTIQLTDKWGNKIIIEDCIIFFNNSILFEDGELNAVTYDELKQSSLFEDVLMIMGEL